MRLLLVDDQPVPIGSFFLRKIEGWSGEWIKRMQWFVRGGSDWTHAGIILGNGQFIQGEPGGAKIYPQTLLDDDRPLLISDAPIENYLEHLQQVTMVGRMSRLEVTTRAVVDSRARALEHTPYSYLDYLAIGAVEFHWPGAHLLEGYVESSNHLICSALVDRAYSWSGIHLYDDKRKAGDVTPGDLAAYADKSAGTELIRKLGVR